MTQVLPPLERYGLCEQEWALRKITTAAEFRRRYQPSHPLVRSFLLPPMVHAAACVPAK